jgi:hypothetical protein
MFNWLSKLFKQEESTNNVVLHIEVQPDNKILIRYSWPEHQNEEDFKGVIRKSVGLLSLLRQNKLMPIICHSISTYGAAHNDEKTSKAILLTFDDAMANMPQDRPERGPNEPLVPPTEAFTLPFPEENE